MIVILIFKVLCDLTKILLYHLERVKMLLKSYKTEIKPTKEQMIIINKTIGVCRFVYHHKHPLTILV